MSTYLQAFVERAYPGATVQRHPWDDTFEVRFTVRARELIANRDAALRRVLARMAPQTPPRSTRRIRWGRRNGVAMIASNPRRVYRTTWGSWIRCF